ncbi:MAG: OmpA family protein [Selenomonadaceae bacterium]|nr:OmpA family protein [Selenomonadaceae bacterium]
MIFRKEPENIWTSISDLMTGLMIIFLFVCLGFLYQLQEQQRQLQEQQRQIAAIKNQYEAVRHAIYKDLIDEFKPEEMAGWGAQIDDMELRVIFIAPSVFFDVGSSAVKPTFQQVLNEFFPRYIKVLERYSSEIVEVRIEGNASIEEGESIASNPDYFRNMRLSQERAFNVLQYVFSLGAVQDKRQWMIDKLRANGASFSKANLEKAAASRCVEISIRRNAEGALKDIERH